MGYFTVSLLFLMVLALLGELVNCSEESQNSTETRRRAGRTDYPVYSPPDDYASKKKSPEYFAPDPVYKEDAVSNFQPGKEPKDQQDSKKAPPQFTPPPSDGYYYKPKPRYYSPKDIMYKSGTNVNWNVWKGDGPEGSDVKQPPPIPEMKGAPPPDFEEYYFPADPWKEDAWTPEKMATMLMMMKEMQMKPRPSSILSFFKKDPSSILLAAAIPVSLILAAVLPTLMNMMMNGGLPTVTTTATGPKARRLVDQEYLSPIINALSTFGSRALDNPECMQRIFCQVTKNPKDNSTESGPMQKIIYRVSRFVDDNYLKNLGIKNLVDSMADGDCEKIPCSNFKSKDSKDDSKKGKTIIY